MTLPPYLYGRWDERGRNTVSEVGGTTGSHSDLISRAEQLRNARLAGELGWLAVGWGSKKRSKLRYGK